MQQTTITINPNITYQMMNGWEATDQAGQLEFPAIFPKYKDQLFDQTINDLGINRVRLEIFSGAENPVDHFSQYTNGQISRQQWKDSWYQIINDNIDPKVLNPAGFQFSQMDATIETVVNPLRSLAFNRGEKLYINLNYVDFRPSAFEHKDSPEEYGEFMLATFEHIKSKYGWSPDAIEVVLENDNADWSGTQIGNAIVAAGNRLRVAGFNPQFIGPSSTNMNNAISSFDEMIQIPGIFDYLSEFSYHRYGGANGANTEAIGSRALQNGITAAHLELIGATFDDLYQDLTLGRNSAWAQYTIAWPLSDGTDDGGKYYLINDGNPDNPQIVLGQRTRYLRQYFKYVRRGAMRIEATADNNNYKPVAFVNADCSQVVVIKADTGGSFSIQGLPAGTYGIKYSTESQIDINAPDATISAGQLLNTSIPGFGVITIYGKNALCAQSASVSAASYRIDEIAAGSITATFGTNLASATVIADSTPLPTSLAGTTLTIIDHLGVSRLSPLFFVSPNQVNFVVPDGTAPGQAVLRLTNAAGETSYGLLQIAKVAPGIFTADSSGNGLPAGVILRIKANNEQTYEPLVRFDQALNKIVAVPVDLSNPQDQVILVLYGTGINRRMDLTTVSARIGDVTLPVIHAQVQGDFVGLDQVALQIPQQLAGSGDAGISILIDGKPCNAVSINIQ
ncbi:MAG: hypothetical protein IPM55_09385 [Acidobacteria bacterium]|nr:hypothetical protein [Acidobacteriota bacterium]